MCLRLCTKRSLCISQETPPSTPHLIPFLSFSLSPSLLKRTKCVLEKVMGSHAWKKTNQKEKSRETRQKEKNKKNRMFRKRDKGKNYCILLFLTNMKYTSGLKRFCPLFQRNPLFYFHSFPFSSSNLHSSFHHQVLIVKGCSLFLTH